MNSLDRAIAYVAPKWAARRAIARVRIDTAAKLSATYDGAGTGRATAGWTSGSLSGTALVGAASVNLRNRSRELVRNNHYAANARRQWANRVVGTGIRLRADQRVVDLWERWQASASEEFGSIYSMMWHACAARWESGEVFLRRRIRRPEDGGVLPLRIQVLEADFLNSQLNEALSGQSGSILQGIEFDPIGRRRAYHMFRAHPGDSFMSSLNGYVSTPVPAEEILHLYVPARPGAIRGIPELAPVMLRMRDLDDYEYAHLAAKRVQACMAAFVIQSEAGALPLNASTTTDSIRTERIEPATFHYLRPGEDVKFSAPTSDATYSDYKTHVVRDIAAGLGMPFEVVSGNLSTVNYSSYRGGLIAFADAIEVEQWNTMIPQVCEPIFRWFVQAARIAGLLSGDGDIAHEWSPPEFRLLDRASEAAADETELRIGSATWPQVIGRKGYDPEQQLAEIEQWQPRIAAALAQKQEKVA